MTELHKINRGDQFMLAENPKQPPGSGDVDIGKIYKLINLDGMYSYCTDKEGNVFHFAAWTDVHVLAMPHYDYPGCELGTPG